MELLHMAIFLLYKFFNVYDNILLLGCMSPLYKDTHKKLIQILFQVHKFALSSFSFYTYVLFEKRPMFC